MFATLISILEEEYSLKRQTTYGNMQHDIRGFFAILGTGPVWENNCVVLVNRTINVYSLGAG